MNPLRVVPLGGHGEIGKNMLALEYGEDIVVIDAGVLFPDESTPGVDFAIPDITYLLENRSRVRAILITHGHEDHIGALPWVLEDLDVPVYAPRLAHGLISVKLRERGMLADARLNVVEPYEPFRVGELGVEFFRVCHSIPDAMGIAVTTPLGVVIHTGDFKIDHSPADGKVMDFAALARMASEGVLLLCSDSTYAEVEGYTLSEQVVGEAPGQGHGRSRGTRDDRDLRFPHIQGAADRRRSVQARQEGGGDRPEHDQQRENGQEDGLPGCAGRRPGIGEAGPAAAPGRGSDSCYGGPGRADVGSRQDRHGDPP